MVQLGNVITAMITPFYEDGSVDYEGAVQLAQDLCQKRFGQCVACRNYGRRRDYDRRRKVDIVSGGPYGFAAA